MCGYFSESLAVMGVDEWRFEYWIDDEPIQKTTMMFTFTLLRTDSRIRWSSPNDMLPVPMLDALLGRVNNLTVIRLGRLYEIPTMSE